MLKLKATTASITILALLLLSNASCTADGEGQGKLVVRATGEDGVKTGFPITEGDETIEFTDGWSVKFTKYLVSVGEIKVADSSGEITAQDPTGHVVDLHTSDPELVVFEDIPAKRWDDFSFAITAPNQDSIKAADVKSEDLARMIDNQFNYWIEGTATKGEQTVTFAWGLKNPTKNTKCINGADDTQGVVIKTNSETTAEITFHVEHMFWTSLGIESTELRFEAIAAMADNNGAVSWGSLHQQELTNLKDQQGNPLKDEQGQLLVYNPGSKKLATNTLDAFILASTATEAHLNGGGLCTVSAL